MCIIWEQIRKMIDCCSPKVVAGSPELSDADFPSIVLTNGSRFAIGKIKHGDANELTLYSRAGGFAGKIADSVEEDL